MPREILPISSRDGSHELPPCKCQTVLLTVREAAQRLRCSLALVYELCAAGRIGHHRLGMRRGTIRISTADLEVYLASVQIESGELRSAAGLKHIRLQKRVSA